MEQSDIIIQGIHDLGELQGEKRIILEKVKTTSGQSRDIEDILRKLPSYVDKCDYLKTLSDKFINRASETSSRADDIVEMVSVMKKYIESSGLDSCKNGKTIKNNILRDLQALQNTAYFIVRPDSQGNYEQYSFTEGPIIPRGGKKKRTFKKFKYLKHNRNRKYKKSKRII